MRLVYLNRTAFFIFILSVLLILFACNRSNESDKLRRIVHLLKDRSSNQVFSIQNAYLLLDTGHVKTSADELLKSVNHEDHETKFRAKALTARFLFYWIGPGDTMYANQLKDALEKAYVLNSPFMIAQLSRWYGELLNSLGSEALAAKYCMNALKMQKEIGFEYFDTPKTLFLTTAEMLYQTQNYEVALQYYIESLKLPDDSLSPKQYVDFKNRVAHALNAMGRSYNAIKKYDSSVFYFQACSEYVMKHNLDESMMELAFFNRFDPLLELRSFDSCSVIAEKLYRLGIPDDTLTLVSAYFMKGRLALRMGSYLETVKWGLLAETMGKKYQKQLFGVYKDLATAYFHLNKLNEHANYTLKWRLLDDENQRIKLKANAAFLESESDFQNSRLKVIGLKKERERHIFLRNILVLFLLSGFLGLLIFFNQMQKKSKIVINNMKLRNHFFEKKIKNAEEQMDAFKREVHEKNMQIEDLISEKLVQVETGKQLERIHSLSQSIILTESDWDLFRESFELVFPGFLTALKWNAPDITNAEIRMACLIRLNFDSKHIAGMLGISPESVRKTKYRLKKRFGGLPEQSLETIISEIK